MRFLVYSFFIVIIGLIIGIASSLQEKIKKKREQEELIRTQFKERGKHLPHMSNMSNSSNNSIQVSIKGSIIDDPDLEDEEPFEYLPLRNEWFMTKYKVTGTNPKTNRKKGNEVVIVGDDENKAIERSGLINVISVEKIEPYEPTENQIKYGDRLGMEHKCSYSGADYSAILTMYECRIKKFEYTPIELAEYATQYHVYISSYCTFSSFLNILFDKLPKEEKIIFFASCVYQSYKGLVTYIPAEHPNYNDFCEFMEYAKQNDSFMKSIYYYSGTELNPKRAIKKLKAKEICMNFFNL